MGHCLSSLGKNLKNDALTVKPVVKIKQGERHKKLEKKRGWSNDYKHPCEGSACPPSRHLK